MQQKVIHMTLVFWSLDMMVEFLFIQIHEKMA